MNIQFKKGVLEMCVLVLLGHGDRYGYDIAAALGDCVSISDGTVYPILRRLLSEGYLSSYLKESSEGPPRKYYALTENGRVFRDVLVVEWDSFVRQINGILTDPPPPRAETNGKSNGGSDEQS